MDKNEETEDFDISLEKRFHKIKSLITKFLRHCEFDLKKPNIFTDNILKTLYFQNLCAGEIMNVLIENNLKKYCDVIKHLFLSQQIVMKNIVNTISEHIFEKENFQHNSKNLILNTQVNLNLKKKRKKKFKETMKKINYQTSDPKDKIPIERLPINNITYEIKEKKNEKIKNSISELDQKAFKALNLLNTGKGLTKENLEDPLLLLRVNKLLSNDIINGHLSKFEEINRWMSNSSKILNNSKNFKDVKNKFGYILSDMNRHGDKDKEFFAVFDNRDKIMKFSEFEEAVKDRIENGYYILFDRIVKYLRKEKAKKEIGKFTQTQMTHVILDKQKMFLEQKNNKNIFLIEKLNEENEYYRKKISDLDFQVENLKEEVQNLLKKNEKIHFEKEKFKTENFFEKTNKNKLKNEIKTHVSFKDKIENKFKKSLGIISSFKKNLRKIFSKIKNPNVNFNEFQNEIFGIDRILQDCTFSVENYCFDLINKIKSQKISFHKNNSETSNSYDNVEEEYNIYSNPNEINRKKNNFGVSKDLNKRNKKNSFSLFILNKDNKKKHNKNNSQEKFNFNFEKNDEMPLNKTRNKFENKSNKSSFEINFEIEKISKAQTLYTKKFLDKTNPSKNKNNKTFLVKKNNKKYIKINKNYKKNYYIKTTKKSNSIVLMPKPKKRVLRLSLFNVNNNMNFKEPESYNNLNSNINNEYFTKNDLKKNSSRNFKNNNDFLKNKKMKILNTDLINKEESESKLENSVEIKKNIKIQKKFLNNKKNKFNNLKVEYNYHKENNNIDHKNKRFINYEFNFVFICKTCSKNPKINEIMKFFKKGININKESEVIGKSFSHLETYKFYIKLKKIFEKKIDSKNKIIDKKINLLELEKKNTEESINLLFKRNLTRKNKKFLPKKKKDKNIERINKKIEDSKIKINSEIKTEEKIKINKIINLEKPSENFIPKQKKIKELMNSDLNLKKTILSNLLKDMRINQYKTDICSQKNLYLMEINKMKNSKEDDFTKNFKIEDNPMVEPINYFLKKIYTIIYSIKFKKISKSKIIDFQNKIILGSNSSLNVSGKKISTEFILFKITEFLNKFGNHFLKEDLKKKSEILIESFINFHKECKPDCNHLDVFYDYLKKYIHFRLEQKNYPVSKIFFGGSLID